MLSRAPLGRHPAAGRQTPGRYASPLGAVTQAKIQQNINRTGAEGRRVASNAQAWAKRWAPWQNRTGEARRRLTVRFLTRSTLHFVLSAAHGVFYGRFLEYRWAGRFAILRPTIMAYGPKLLAALAQVWRNAPGRTTVGEQVDVSSTFNPRASLPGAGRVGRGGRR